MSQSRYLPAALAAVGVLLLVSCTNSGDDATPAETTPDSAAPCEQALTAIVDRVEAHVDDLADSRQTNVEDDQDGASVTSLAVGD